MGPWGGSVGGGMHGLDKVLIFPFCGRAVVKSEKVGWVSLWDGAVLWEEINMFHI